MRELKEQSKSCLLRQLFKVCMFAHQAWITLSLFHYSCTFFPAYKNGLLKYCTVPQHQRHSPVRDLLMDDRKIPSFIYCKKNKYKMDMCMQWVLNQYPKRDSYHGKPNQIPRTIVTRDLDFLLESNQTVWNYRFSEIFIWSYTVQIYTAFCVSRGIPLTLVSHALYKAIIKAVGLPLLSCQTTTAF